MARFKFGKKKKQDAYDTSASIDEESIDDHHSNLDHLPAATVVMAQPEAEYKNETIPAETQVEPQEMPLSILKNQTPVARLSDASTPWTRYKLANSPFPRYRHSASAISSEKNEVFIMGGLKEGSVFGDTWKVFPHIDSSGHIQAYSAEPILVANSNNPPARVGHSSVLIGNAFIIYGGDTVDTDFNGFPDNNFYLFNINNNKYTIPSHILNKPNGRYGHTICVVSLNNQSSRLYLFGGQLENDVFNDLYYFELNTFKSPKAKWELAEPLNNFRPPPLTNHTMSVYKNRIYIFGGVYNNEKVSNDLWCYDAGSSKWSQISTSGNTPLPVNEHSACIVNDKLYVYGGNDFSGIIYNSLYVLDLHTLVWSKLTTGGEVDGPGSRCGHSMSFLPNMNKLIVMGGDKNDYVSSDPNDFQTYETKDPNEQPDTIIFELDLDVVESFLSSKQTVIKASKKKAAAAAAAAAVTGATVLGGEEAYQRHARSFSAGPEDFRTPEVSPQRTQIKSTQPIAVPDESFQPSADKFVDVPSSTQSEKDITEDESEHPTFENRNLPEPSIPAASNFHNGHSQFEADRESNNSTPILAKSAENDKVKKLINELTSELTNLKKSTKVQMQNATEKIHELEEENKRLKSSSSNAEDLEGLKNQVADKDQVILELKQQIDPSLLLIEEEEGEEAPPLTRKVSSSITELSKYKLERLELSNKLFYLTKENNSLKAKMEEFEPFMNNQIGQLSNFQRIIKAQEEKNKLLTQQVRDQEVLHKEINDLKTKYNNLELEYNNFKTVHADDDISDSEDEDDEALNGIDSGNRSLASNSTARRSKKDISSHLENLVQLWSVRQPSSAAIEARSPEAVDPMVIELQKQLDGLMKISKEQELTSTREIANLKHELEMKIINLKSFEDNYRDALQSVNNTSKALNLTQEELNNQKTLMEKLIKENNELKLFKRASRRASTRVPTGGSDNPQISETIPETEQEEDDNAMENAHFNMKIKDLEADLFILKQERNQLKESVTSLQKKLYLAENST